jgi:putative peptidoglycan lipid II flippase
VLGVASTLGMTVSAAVLALLVRKAWGVEAVRGAGRTLGAAVVAVAVGLAVGDTAARGLSPDSLWPALGSGLLVGLVTLVAYLGVMMVADRKAMQALRERGRSRRRGTTT